MAHHLARSFKGHAHIRLVQAFNHRKSKSAIEFAKENGTELVSDYNNIHTQADVYFICVKDDALADVVQRLSGLQLKGLLVHTSGSMDRSVLNTASKKTGVYYPLQTFSAASVIDWKTTPVLIEANNASSLKVLKTLASSVSGTVKVVDSETRLKLHLAAVFASNFTNALYAAAFGFVEANLNKKDTALLYPLMKEAFTKLAKLSPKQAQTGPAMRHDTVVMKKHLALLRGDKQLGDLYKQLSGLIVTQQTQT